LSQYTTVPFEEAIFDATGGNPRVLTSGLAETGRFPVVDQGKKFVSGYVDDAELLCRRNNDAVILFGDHTKVIKYVDFDFVLGADGVKVLEARTGFDSRFLFHFLNTIRLPDNLGYSRHFKYLKRADVPKPPIDKQRRIASILDKADAIRAKRRKVLKLTDEFQRSVFFDMFGDPVTQPKGWPMLPLSSISERIQIGPFGTQLHQEDYIEGGVPLVNPTHIIAGKICVNRSLTISEQLYSKLTEYHMVNGDVIMGRRGEMGRCALVTEAESGFLCGTGSLFIRPDRSKVKSIYLSNVLSSESAKLSFERASLGATMPNLNKSIVSNFEIGIPPIKLQEKFSNFVTTNSHLTAKCVNAVAEADALFYSLLQQTFGTQQ
jgi:type I restriction enzyme S subunit